LGLADVDLQLRVLRAIEKRGISVRQTEELVRRLMAATSTRKQAPADQAPETRALEDRFRRALGTKVNLYRSRRGGRLVIHFFSEEELQTLYDRIVREEL